MSEARAAQGLYERMLGFLGEETRFINQGFWRDAPATHDEACRAMARLLGRAAGLGPGQRVLDVGFGWGEQDVLWMRELAPDHIVGVNVTPVQVEGARARAREEGLQERLTFQLASATELPFADASFHRVTALECAHHFGTRVDFFREAHRVLLPGGRIATTDIIPMGVVGPRGKLRPAWDPSWMRNDTLMPPANVRTRQQYADDLRSAGFEDVRVISIREHVYAPQARHLAARLRDGSGLPAALRGLEDADRMDAVEQSGNPGNSGESGESGGPGAALERRRFSDMVKWSLTRLADPRSADAWVREAQRGPLDYVLATGARPAAGSPAGGTS